MEIDQNLQINVVYGHSKRLLLYYFPPSFFGAVVGSGKDKNQDPGSGINIPDPSHWNNDNR
jgi:hypothetical protein